MSNNIESFTVTLDGMTFDIGRLRVAFADGKSDIQLITDDGPYLPFPGGTGIPPRPLTATFRESDPPKGSIRWKRRQQPRPDGGEATGIAMRAALADIIGVCERHGVILEYSDQCLRVQTSKAPLAVTVYECQDGVLDVDIEEGSVLVAVGEACGDRSDGVESVEDALLDQDIDYVSFKDGCLTLITERGDVVSVTVGDPKDIEVTLRADMGLD